MSKATKAVDHKNRSQTLSIHEKFEISCRTLIDAVAAGKIDVPLITEKVWRGPTFQRHVIIDVDIDRRQPWLRLSTKGRIVVPFGRFMFFGLWRYDIVPLSILSCEELIRMTKNIELLCHRKAVNQSVRSRL